MHRLLTPICIGSGIIVVCIADDSLSFRNSCLARLALYIENFLVRGLTTKRGCHISSLPQGCISFVGPLNAETELLKQLSGKKCESLTRAMEKE